MTGPAIEREPAHRATAPAQRPGSAGALLEVSSLCAGYGGARVLHGVTLSVPAQSITVLLGANGAGKTTTLRALSALIKSAGEIRLAGERIDGCSTEEIVRKGVAHVPQGRAIFEFLSTEENLKLGAHTRGDRAEVAQDLEFVYTCFPRLRERRRQAAGTLSGGEQQMLALSTALMSRPRLLLLDEPSTGLAHRVVHELFHMLRALNEERGIGMLLVEQNASLALEFADRAYVIETGRIVHGASAQDLRHDDAVRRSYLGA